MKLAVILEDTIASGGGFNQALNAIIQVERMSQGKFSCVVMTNKSENLSVLRQLGVTAIVFKTKLMDKMIELLSQNELTRRLLRRFKWISPFEKFLIKNKCELVYFVAPTSRALYLQRLNFILTIWDNCHRDFPEFPEVREHGEFMRREFSNQLLSQAILILVDSEQLSKRLILRYGLNQDRLFVMPFEPNPLLKAQNKSDHMSSIIKKYGLNQEFLLYPAQFWPHKNHIRIIQALEILKKQGKTPVVVFVGGDKGNKKRVADAVKKAKLEKQVIELGFISNEDLSALYEGCLAVVMPTYFGPTNLPPLEAWQARKPLIYSYHLRHQCMDAAILIDPDDPDSLARAIVTLDDQNVRCSLIDKGLKRLDEINIEREKAIEKFELYLNMLERRYSTWR